jgi:hypothetical protein
MRVYRIGFPHSEISGSTVICTFPKLIAACHVLRHLLTPRHPPYTLSNLIQNSEMPVTLTQQIVKERIWLIPPGQLLFGGDNRARTGNLRRARAALSQLSYIPKKSITRTWWA